MMPLRSLRIALLTYATKPRGSVVHTLELAIALTELGHQVCVYALDKDGQGFERSLPCVVRLIPAQPAPLDVDRLIHQRIHEFVQALEQAPAYDIYHAQDCIGANALVQQRERGHIPHVVRTVHHIEDYTSPYLQQCQDRSIRAPDLCLCVSDRWQQALATDYGITAPRVLNGVDTTRFTAVPTGQEANLKAMYGLSGSPIYLTIGGIEPRKNSIHLLRAFAQVLAHQPQAQLVIAGGATLFDYQPYREEFFRVAEALAIPVGRSLILPGVIPETALPVLYRCADAFCFPSLKEGWGLVVLEAIAAGLPIVVSDQPPFTEFLALSQAIWVNPNVPTAIAQGMVAATQPETAIALIQASQSVLAQYSWRRSAQFHIDHYHKLLGQSRD